MSAQTQDHDPYLESREIETTARREDSAEAWTRFADLKVKKGSYAPATTGYLNAGIAFEKANNTERAIESYTKGADVARKASHTESLLMLSTRLAALLERDERYEEGARIYEELSDYYVEKESWFLAADASDHAAEFLRAAGKDLSDYRRPEELWNRNAEYWAGKDEKDEAWSRRRAEKYVASITE